MDEATKSILRFIIILIMLYIIGWLIGSMISNIINPQPQQMNFTEYVKRVR